MSVPISPVSNNQVFGTWLARTNQMAAVITANAVTTDTSVLGGFTNGNGTVNGYFGSNTLFTRDALRGGNVTASNTLFVSTNTIFIHSPTGNRTDPVTGGIRTDTSNLIHISSSLVGTSPDIVLVSNLFSNVTHTTIKSSSNTTVVSNNYISNAVSNAFINSGNLTVNTTSNAAITSNTLYITSANAFINSNNITVTTISNAGIVSNTLTVQSVNAYVNSTNITVNTSVNAYILSANLNVNTTANTTVGSNNLSISVTSNTLVTSNNLSVTASNNVIVTGNVYINSSASYAIFKMDAPSNTVQVNATSVNVASNTTFTGTNTSMISNAYVSANLTVATNTYVGHTITVGGTGGNVFVNTTSFKITNNALIGAANLVANVTSLVYSNVISTSTLTPASLSIVGTTVTTAVISVSNAVGSVYIYPAESGVFGVLATGIVNASSFTTTGNANATNFYSGPNFIANSSAIKWTSTGTTVPSISLANTGALTIGSGSLTQTASKFDIANSSGNVVITPLTFTVANATQNVVVTAADITVGNSIVYGYTNSSLQRFVDGANTSTLKASSLLFGSVTATNTPTIWLANSIGNVAITSSSLVLSNSTVAVVTLGNTGISVNGFVNTSTVNVGTGFSITNTELKYLGDTTSPFLKPTVSITNTGSISIGNAVSTATGAVISVANTLGSVQIVPTGIKVSNTTLKTFESNTTGTFTYLPATISNNVTISESGKWANVLGTFAVQGASQFNEKVTVSNATDLKGMDVYGPLTAYNNFEIKGNLIIAAGGSLSSTVSGTASILPTVSSGNYSAYDIGDGTHYWRGIYANTGNFAGTDGVTTTKLTVSTTSSFTGLASFGAIKASSTITANSGVKFDDGSVYSSSSNIGDNTTKIIDTFDPVVYRAVEYTVSIGDLSGAGDTNPQNNYQISKIIAVHDGTTVSLTEYSVMSIGTKGAAAALGLFTADITGTAPSQTFNLKFQPVSGITKTSIKIARLAMAV